MKALQMDDLLKWIKGLPFAMNADPRGYLSAEPISNGLVFA